VRPLSILNTPTISFASIPKISKYLLGKRTAWGIPFSDLKVAKDLHQLLFQEGLAQSEPVLHSLKTVPEK